MIVTFETGFFQHGPEFRNESPVDLRYLGDCFVERGYHFQVLQVLVAYAFEGFPQGLRIERSAGSGFSFLGNVRLGHGPRGSVVRFDDVSENIYFQHGTKLDFRKQG